MPEERFGESLQESILAVLAFNQEHGGLVAAQVTPESFDGVYNEIAAPVLAYRRKYNKPPGLAHLESLFSRAKLDPSDRRTHVLRKALFNLSTLAEAVNGEYIANQTQSHVRSQKLKTALLQANERYLQGGDDAVVEVEGILHSALRFRQQTLDAGTFLTDYVQALRFTRRNEDFISLGIPQLDRVGLGIAPKQMLQYIAVKGSGKSWFCVHCGRQALLQKQKVLHVSLEMDEARVLARYYQSFFGIARRPDQITRATFELDELERVTGLPIRRSKPKLVFTDPSIAKILRKKVQHWGTRFRRLVIKHFSSGTLTMSQLRGYLDYLEMVHKFIPNVLILDYPRLMKMSADNLRIVLGQTVVDLRGLAEERNMGLVVPTQSNRVGFGAKKVSSANASEDISTVFTADNVLSYMQTEGEKKFGLARLVVDHARDDESGTSVLLTQNYALGQYVADSTLMLGGMYWQALKDLTGDDDAGD